MPIDVKGATPDEVCQQVLITNKTIYLLADDASLATTKVFMRGEV